MKAKSDATGVIVGIDHVNLTIEEGPDALERAKAFYGGILGLQVRPRAEHAESPSGAWYLCGAQQVHLSAESGASASNRASRRHAAFRVANLGALASRLEAAGIETRAGNLIPGQKRFFVRDPFGNRLEFVEVAD